MTNDPITAQLILPSGCLTNDIDAVINPGGKEVGHKLPLAKGYDEPNSSS